VTVSRPGEVYELGPHRLLCGDCRKPEDVARVFAGERAVVAMTSPPYASQRKYDPASGFVPIPPDEYVEWFRAVQANVLANLAIDGSWFVNIKEHAENGTRHIYVHDLVIAHVRHWGWRFVDELCWLRIGFPSEPKRSRRFKNAFEPVYHFAKTEGFKFRPDNVRHHSNSVPKRGGGRGINLEGNNDPGTIGGMPESGGISAPGLAYPSNVLNLKINPPKNAGHPAAYPADLPMFFFRAYSDPGDLVYDPFAGSGTVFVAASATGRRAVGTEISAFYCDGARKRWTAYARANGLPEGSGALEPDPTFRETK
jgi:site-specific DNA-methyltransferase (adenine-specific)